MYIYITKYIYIKLNIYTKYIYIHMCMHIYIITYIPLKIHPKGSWPPFCSYKTRGLEKYLQNDGVPMIFSPYKMVRACASTTSFQHPSILYGGILSPDVLFFP